MSVVEQNTKNFTEWSTLMLDGFLFVFIAHVEAYILISGDFSMGALIFFIDQSASDQSINQSIYHSINGSTLIHSQEILEGQPTFKMMSSQLLEHKST